MKTGEVLTKLFEGSKQLEVMAWLPDEGECGVAGTLVVQFKTGVSYEYRRVPLEVAKGLAEAESAGSYFHRWIRGNDAKRPLYEFRRLLDGDVPGANWKEVKRATKQKGGLEI